MRSSAYTVTLLLGFVSLARAARPLPYVFRNESHHGTDTTNHGSGSDSHRPVDHDDHDHGGSGHGNHHPPPPISFTNPTTTTRTFINTEPTATLAPVVHWTIDTARVENVIPVQPDQGSELYYGVSSPTESGHYAFLKYFFLSPSVNVGHSKYIQVKYDGASEVTASFSSQDAYDHARTTWSTRDGLVLITTGCEHLSANADLCYFNVTSLHYIDQERKIVADGGLREPDDIISYAETEWGWWTANEPAPGADAHKPGADAHKANETALGDNADKDQAWGSGTLELDCQAPKDNVYGLPTACLGSHFDQTLDEQLGYSKLSPDVLKSLDSLRLPGGKLPRPHPNVNGTQPKTMVQGWWSKAWGWVESAVTIEKSIEHQFSFQIPNPNSKNSGAKTLAGVNTTEVQSPWGSAILLKSFGSEEEKNGRAAYLKAYCVGCGASGSARAAGRLAWSPLEGFKKGNVEMHANLRFVLKVGVEAQATLQKDFDFSLFSYGLPGLSWGVVTIGPFVDLGARLSFNAKARGEILAGAEMGIQDGVVLIDFLDSSRNKKSGWEPYFTPVFEAKGELNVGAELGLPVGVKVGIKIPKWEKTVGITDEPSIKATAQIAASAGIVDGKISGGVEEVDGCRGILGRLSWRNRFWIGFGTDGNPLFDTNDRTVGTKCFPIGPPKAAENNDSTEEQEEQGEQEEQADQGDQGEQGDQGGEADQGDQGEQEEPAPETEQPEQPESTPEADPAGQVEPAVITAPVGEPSSIPETETVPESEQAGQPQPAEQTGQAEPAAPMKRRASASPPRLAEREAEQPHENKLVDMTSALTQSTPKHVSYNVKKIAPKLLGQADNHRLSRLLAAADSTKVVACANGNLYAVKNDDKAHEFCFDAWTVSKNSSGVVYDGVRRTMHYYSNTMSKLGVSRVRASHPDRVPQGSVPIVLAPSLNRNKQKTYVAVDVQGKSFFPIVCNYPGAHETKLFLAKDTNTGIKLLLNKDLMYSVTGGKPTRCVALRAETAPVKRRSS